MKKGTRTQTTMRLPDELLEQLKAEAQKRGDSINETIIRLLRLGFQAELSRIASHSSKQLVS